MVNGKEYRTGYVFYRRLSETKRPELGNILLELPNYNGVKSVHHRGKLYLVDARNEDGSKFEGNIDSQDLIQAIVNSSMGPNISMRNLDDPKYTVIVGMCRFEEENIDKKT